jgi:hypothetical protein
MPQTAATGGGRNELFSVGEEFEQRKKETLLGLRLGYL